MSRRRRWLIGSLIALALLLLGLVLLWALLLSPARLKARIEHEVRAATGLVLKIDGDLEWHAWPLLQVSMGAARVMVAGEGAGAPGVAAAPFARWRALAATAHWAPLLHGQWVIDDVRVKGLDVGLQRGADGAIQWPRLAPVGGGNGAAAKPPGGRGAVTLGRLELVDAAVHVDAAPGAGAGAAAGGPGAVRLDALQLQSGIAYDGAAGTLRLRDLALRGTAHAAPLPPGGVPIALAAPQLALRQRPLQLEPAELKAQVAGLALDARLEGVADLATPAARGQLHAAAPSVRALAHELGIELPPARDPQVYGAVDVASGWRLDAAALALENLRVQADGHTFTGSASAPLTGDGPARFALAGDRVDLDKYLRPKDQPGEPFVLPVEQLRALRVEGVLELKEARLLGNRVRGARLKVIDRVGGKR